MNADLVNIATLSLARHAADAAHRQASAAVVAAYNEPCSNQDGPCPEHVEDPADFCPACRGRIAAEREGQQTRQRTWTAKRALFAACRAYREQQATQPPAGGQVPMVYVLFHETNTGHSEVSDGYVEAVYATQAAADAARLEAITDAKAKGLAIYFDPETGEDFPETWEHDWTVIPHEVIAGS